MIDSICLDEDYSTTRVLYTIEDDSPPPHPNVDHFNTYNVNINGCNGGLRTAGYYKMSSPKSPLITIITAVYNGEKYLEETILSVVRQSYNNIEFIVIDGGSSDGTLDIIKKYDHCIDYWISEKDSGISDAFNKGVILSRGDYINFQGDGDGFCSVHSVRDVISGVNPKIDTFVSGRIRRISENGDVLFVSSHKKRFNKCSLLFRMSLPHQGLFTNITYFRKYGLFDVDNTFCMDYEHLLRSYHDFPCVLIKDTVVANWRADGIGNNRDLQIFKEYNQIKVKNNIASPSLLKFVNYWTLLKFYIKKTIHA